MLELDTNLPSIRTIQSLIKDKKEVEMKLVTDDLLVGRIFWQDTECVSLIDREENKIIVWRQAIAFIKPKS